MKCNFFMALAATLVLTSGTTTAAESTASMTLDYQVQDLSSTDGQQPQAFPVYELTRLGLSLDGCCAGPGPVWEGGFLPIPATGFYGPYLDVYATIPSPGSVSAFAWDSGESVISEDTTASFYVAPYTSATFTFSALVSATRGHGTADATVCFMAERCADFLTGAGPDAHQISFTYANWSNNSAEVDFEGRIYAIAEGVPEPAESMLLALGAIPFLARRGRLKRW